MKTIQAVIIMFGTSGPATTVFANSNEVLVAVRAHSGERQARQQWGATIDYLNQALPRYRFVMHPYTNIQKLLADADTRKYHFLLTNPATYVESEVRHGAKAMLTLVNNRNGTAQTRFGSVIFTHIDHTGILTLADLKGKDFLAVNLLGFGGWRAGLKTLRDHGLDPRSDFNSLSFAGEQPAVVHAVLDKKVHAGMVRTDMLERLAARGEINLRNVRVLNPQLTPDFPFFHSTPLYPEWPFAVMPHTSAEMAERVKLALLGIQATHPAARAGRYLGWIPALDYQPVKDLLRDIGIPHFAEDTNVDTHSILLIIIPAGLLLALVAVTLYRRQCNR